MNFSSGISFGKVSNKKRKVYNSKNQGYKVLHSLKSILNSNRFSFLKIKIIQMKKLMKDLIIFTQII
jgi:hypothetical protein